MSLLRSSSARAGAALLALAASAATRSQEQTPASSPAALAAALQQKYDAVKDFTAEFTQTARAGVLKRQLTERGRVMIKKPGKMRWVYTSPEHKEFVSDGLKYYQYYPQDKQVIVSQVPDAGGAAFLAGKGNLQHDFVPSFMDPPAGLPAGTLALKLVPKTPQPNYDWLMLAVEPGTLALRGLMTADAQGGTSTFTFTNVKENVGLADKLFAFAPPRGADIVTDSPPR